MNDRTAIILDLDDTIFQTRSMDKKVFEPFFLHFAEGLKSVFSADIIDQILDDLWQNTWDQVMKKFSIPKPVLLQSISVLDKLELDLNISPYPDYVFIKALSCPKFLVTTSLTSLQESKIRALNIAGDFEKIIVNDTFRESKTKLDIFESLQEEYQLAPEHTYVIGDNAESEISAGNALDMVTIQILRDHVVKGNNARHYIQSFEELLPILNASSS